MVQKDNICLCKILELIVMYYICQSVVTYCGTLVMYYICQSVVTYCGTLVMYYICQSVVTYCGTLVGSPSIVDQQMDKMLKYQ